MALFYHSAIGALTIAALSTAMPSAATAQPDTAEAPTPILKFSAFGSPEAEDFPVEINETSPIPPMEVTDLGQTSAAPANESIRKDRTLLQSTWSIGVFR